MRALLIIIIFILSSQTHSFSKNYYISSSTGSDSYSSTQAQNQATPWKSIEKLNSSMSMIQPGDSILFKRGDVFHGEIKLTRSGTENARIVMGAYGKGETPVISASLPVTGWTSYSGNIWVADCPQLGSRVNIFFINGVSQQIGRYPDANASEGGYLKIESHSGYTGLTCSALASSPDFNGGEAVVRSRHWSLDRLPIQSHSGSSLTLGGNTSFEMIDNYGFFIQNHINTLNQSGEWHYNASAKKMYLWYPGNPNSISTEAAGYNAALDISSQSYFTIENLEFSGATNKNVLIFNSRHFSFKNCIISDSGNDALEVIDCEDVEVAGNEIYNTNNCGLGIRRCVSVDVRNNDIRRTGLRAGMFENSVLRFAGLYIYGREVNCESNYIDSTGYIGLSMNGDLITVKNNYIAHFCMTLDDGGGIYMMSDYSIGIGGNKIEGNIILNGIGASNGTNSPGSGSAQGIYMDDRSHNADIIGNTVAHCYGYGIYIHNSKDFSIKNNTSYNNKVQLAFVHDIHASDYPIRNAVVTDNILYSKSSSQLVAYFRTMKDDINQFGSFDRNYYCRPMNENMSISITYVGASGYVSKQIGLNEWKQTFNYDINSITTPYQITNESVTDITGNNIYSNGTFDNDNTGWSCWSNYGNCISMWENNGKLDGGCLKLGFEPSSGQQDGFMVGISYPGQVFKDENYLLRFSMVASHPDKQLVVAMRTGTAPLSNIDDEKAVIAKTVRDEYEVVFKPNVDQSPARIDFQIPEDGTTYWIDNVELYGASTKASTIDDFVKFVYNFSTQDVIINDGVEYTEPTGNKTSTLTLKPFTSAILFNEQGNTSNPETNNKPSIDEQLDIEVFEQDYPDILASISASDQDGDDLEYSIISGNDEGIFNINAETGELRFSASIDVSFSGDPSYTLVVRVTDDGTPVEYAETEFTVSLFELLVNHPPEINNQAFIINEADYTELIGTIAANSGDEGQTLHFSILSGNEEGIFSVNVETGELFFVIKPTDFLSENPYELHIEVTDNGQEELSSQAIITINLIPDGNVFYIDPDNTQDLAIDGTIDHPYTSWNDVTWEDGAYYLQKSGTEAKEEKIIISANEITMGSYGSGDSPKIISSAFEYSIKVLDKHDITIRNLHIVAESAIGCVYFIGAECKNNVLEHCKLEGADYGLRMIDGTSYTVKFNVFNNNVDGIYTIAEDAEIFYNVFKGNLLAVNLSSYSINAKIYNNVFYDNRKCVSTSYAEILLYNNIFYMTQSGDQAIDLEMDKLVSNHNIFYPEQSGFITMKEDRYSSLSEFQTKTGLDINSLTADPLFVDVNSDDFSVEIESKAIDAGRLVGLTKDFFGVTVPSGDAPDIGLVESTYDVFTSYNRTESNEADIWSVYPNPSEGIFSLRNNKVLKRNVELLIYDISGDMIFQHLVESDGVYISEINLSEYPKGVYILSIEADDNIHTQKLIVQ